MINPVDPFALAGQIAASEKVHELTHHQSAVQQQHLAHQAKEQAERKRATVSAKTPAEEIVVKGEPEKKEGDRRHQHHDDTPRDGEKKSGDIPEVGEGKIIDIKI